MVRREKNSMRPRTTSAVGAVIALLVVSIPLVGTAFARQEPVASASPAFAPVYMETIPLRNTDPVAIAKSINATTLPEGTRLVKADPKMKRALRVVGTQEAVTAIKSIVALLDVAPRRMSAEVTVERMQFGANGKKTTTPVWHKTINTVTNAANTISFVDTTGAMVAVSITPRLSRTPGTADTVSLKMGARNTKGSSGLERAILLPPKMETKRLIGVTFADDPAIISAVGTGKIPANWKAPFTAYYTAIKVVPTRPATKPGASAKIP